MVASPTWLEKLTWDDDGQGEKTAELYVHKAIWFDRGRQCYLDTYDPPRKATYFGNFLTNPCTSGVRCDGVPFEQYLDCPMSSSSALEEVVNDKLLTRILLAQERVAYPQTLAFPFKSSKTYNPVGVAGISIKKINTRDLNAKQFFTTHVERFTHSLPDYIRKIVVKPSGKMWMGSAGVTFHDRHQTEHIVLACENLLSQLNDGDAILIEVFQRNMPSQKVLPLSSVKRQQAAGPAVTMTFESSAQVLLEEQEFWADNVADENVVTVGTALGFRLRVIVARCIDDTPVITKMVCGVGQADKAINGDNTIPQSLEVTLAQWGVRDPAHRKSIIDAVTEESVSTMNGIVRFEKELLIGTGKTRGQNPARARTELIGIDFMMTIRDGVIVPVVIEVNDHDCTLQAQTLEFMLRKNIGECVRQWVATMIARAQEYTLIGRQLLYVGCGGFSKRNTIDAARRYGVVVFAVDSDPNHYAAKHCKQFLTYDYTDHTRDEEHAENIAKWITELQVELDGVITFWEDCVVLAAWVAKKLGKLGNDPHAVALAKSKYGTQRALMEDKASMQHRPITAMYGLSCMRCKNQQDVVDAMKIVPLPAIIKMEHGSSAFGVKLCINEAEVLQGVDKLTSTYKTDASHPGVGLGFDTSVVMQQYVDGSEHDVDLVLDQGCLVTAFCTDNGLTRLPYFSETSAMMPSRLLKDQQAILISAAHQVLRSIGLTHGVFNVEVKLTSTGPKVIDINARMGGFYIRDWCQRIFAIDLVAVQYLTAVGIRPAVEQMPQPRKYICGFMAYTSQHQHALNTTSSPERLHELHDRHVLIFNQFEEHIPPVEEFEEPFGSIGCEGETHAEAREKLMSTLRVLGLDSGEVPIEWYLQSFIDN